MRQLIIRNNTQHFSDYQNHFFFLVVFLCHLTTKKIHLTKNVLLWFCRSMSSVKYLVTKKFKVQYLSPKWSESGLKMPENCFYSST